MVRVLTELANDRLESGDSGTVPLTTLPSRPNKSPSLACVGIIFCLPVF
jgi:hypothetical protein